MSPPDAQQHMTGCMAGCGSKTQAKELSQNSWLLFRAVPCCSVSPVPRSCHHPRSGCRCHCHSSALQDAAVIDTTGHTASTGPTHIITTALCTRWVEKAPVCHLEHQSQPRQLHAQQPHDARRPGNHHSAHTTSQQRQQGLGGLCTHKRGRHSKAQPLLMDMGKPLMCWQSTWHPQAAVAIGSSSPCSLS